MSGVDSYLALRAFVDELARCGLEHACTSPGSRSTPVVLSLAREPRIATSSHMDERCAAFFALGHAKATGIPAAIACTSGTATANYMPAVIEAYEARVPLLVLTADRPPELRQLGAGQTIDQLKLYGDAVKAFFDIDDAPATPERMRWLRQLACRAFITSLEARPGPVHLNFTLREPLVIDGPLPEEPGGGGRGNDRPWVVSAASRREPAPESIDGLVAALNAGTRTVLVAGRSERDPSLGAAVAELAERIGIPVLADPLSGARRGPAAIAHYDGLLRDEDCAEAHRADLIIRVGDLPTSKPLRRWMQSHSEAIQIALDAESAWQDPTASVDTILTADPALVIRAISERLGAGHDASWLDRWRAADAAAARAIATELAGSAISEPGVAAALGRLLPDGATIFAASSMPIRDLESFLAVREPAIRVLSNRGANGIDGTVSAAYGAAAACEGPVVLLTGDVALLHDIGGLAAATRVGTPLTIALINNDGGGIFEFLDVAKEGDDYVEHVATPHGFDFSAAAALYGCEHVAVRSLADFGEAVTRSLEGAGTQIIEVRTRRDENAEIHARISARVAAALATR